MDENRTIGKENRLPWRLPVDLRHFKLVTMGHPVIMGRKTYESIGKPLSGRRNIVVSRQKEFRAAGCETANDLVAAFKLCEGADEVFVMGGADLFRQAMPLAGRLYLTVVHTVIEGDVHFPPIPAGFTLTLREAAEDVHPLEFLRYDRPDHDPAPVAFQAFREP